MDMNHSFVTGGGDCSFKSHIIVFYGYTTRRNEIFRGKVKQSLFIVCFSIETDFTQIKSMFADDERVRCESQ